MIEVSVRKDPKMRFLWPFLLLLVAIFSYLILALQFGVYQAYPIIHYLVSLVALGWLLKQVRKQFSIWGLFLNLFGWMLLLLFGWWTLSFSRYENREINLGEIASIAQVTVNNTAGEQLVLGDVLRDRKATLLVFYRGFW